METSRADKRKEERKRRADKKRMSCDRMSERMRGEDGGGRKRNSGRSETQTDGRTVWVSLISLIHTPALARAPAEERRYACNPLKPPSYYDGGSPPCV